MADITVVTVEYGNPADTASLAASLAALDGSEQIELLIVDNAPGEGAMESVERLNQAMPFPVRRLCPGSNLYYWGGAAYAIDVIRREREEAPRWVVVCNNDITVTNSDFLCILRATEPSLHPILAPAIISSVTGRDQNPVLDEPARFLKRAKWRAFDIAYPIARALLATHGFLVKRRALRKVSRVPAGGAARNRKVYAAHGACVIFSARFFTAGGSFDTVVPLFAEELTLAEEAIRLDLPIFYFPSLAVEHREHSTTGTELTRANYELQRRAHRHYFSLRERSRPRR